MDKIKARNLRKNMTEAERTLWKHLRLRQLGGYKFRRQQPLGKYIVDFVCLGKRLIIEIDGGHHSEQVAYDSERDAWLKSQGFRILRFWNNQVLKEIEVVKEVIAEALSCHSNTPHLNPPPQGGRKLYVAITCGVMLLWQIFDFSSAYAWKLPIEIAAVADDGQKVYNKLVIGIEADATDGFDNLWDAPAILSHPDPESPLVLRAYLTPPPNLPPQGGEEKVLSPFKGEGKGGGEGATKNLWKDIRGTTSKGDTVWDITVDSVPAGKAVVVSWKVPLGLLKPGDRLVLKDNERLGADGQPVETDILPSSSYAFRYDSEGPRSLSLVFSSAPASNSSSGSGSGFGCGTIRHYKDGPPPTANNNGTAILSMVVLFSPLLFLRLLRGLRP